MRRNRTGEIIYLDMGGMIRAPVEVWPMARIAEQVEQACNVLPTKDLPEPITEPEDQWEYNYCPVHRICEG